MVSSEKITPELLMLLFNDLSSYERKTKVGWPGFDYKLTNKTFNFFFFTNIHLTNLPSEEEIKVRKDFGADVVFHSYGMRAFLGC